MAKFLLIDKPKGITSHDVVDKVRRISGERRVGHAGTLDPNATGLLIVGVGREATKQLGDLTKNTKKTYEAEVFLGETTTTDDSEGDVIQKIEVTNPPTMYEIKDTLMSFIGIQEQIPPQFSAIKVKGKKAYDLARKGKNVKLEARKIEIYKIDLIDYDFPILKFNVEVSSGTYIRSLARDLGEKLKTGGYLKNLRRTKIGNYNIKDARKI